MTTPSQQVIIRRPATPGVNFMESIRWAIVTTFKKSYIWLVLSVGLFILSAGGKFFSLSTSTSTFSPESVSGIGTWGTLPTLVDVITLIAALAVTPFLLRMAIHTVDNDKVSWKHFTKDTHFATTASVTAVVYICTISVVSAFTAVGLIGGASVAGTEGEITVAALGLIAVFFVVAGFFTVFISPLIMFMEWYPAEGRTKFADSFKVGFAAGKKNYWSLIGYQVVIVTFSLFVLVITAGLGFVLVLPVSLLATAHIYRQISPVTTDELDIYDEPELVAPEPAQSAIGAFGEGQKEFDNAQADRS